MTMSFAPIFDVYLNYWLADDNRVFSSARQEVVTTADPDYAEWVASGRIASEWPRDEAGAQTDASMQSVLDNHGMFVNLKFYTINKRWRKEQEGVVSTAGFPIRTDDRSQAKLTGLYTASREVPSVITPYQAADNTVHQVDAAGMYQLHVDILTHINFCFETSATVLQGIIDGVITTRDGVDAAFDTPMTQAQKNWLKK